MMKIKPDREGLLTQWDLNRRIQITGLEDISNTEIHFSKPDDTKGAYVVLPVIENGIAFADIPNILLTVSGRIDVFVYRDDHTCVRGVFVVAPREKPDDYIYEETEVLKYEDFVERLDGLETQKEDKANRVTTVDDNSDDEHYPTAKAVYKAIPKSLKNPYSLTFTGAVTGSYDGSKPMTFNIPVGGSGTDISLGVTGASVGDIIKVKQVDANGKPMAWEAAAQAESEVAQVYETLFEVEEAVESVEYDFTDEEGNPIMLKEVEIVQHFISTNVSGADTAIKVLFEDDSIADMSIANNYANAAGNWVCAVSVAKVLGKTVYAISTKNTSTNGNMNYLGSISKIGAAAVGGWGDRWAANPKIIKGIIGMKIPGAVGAKSQFYIYGVKA